MIAFIEGHGMRRFHGYVDYEEVQSVVWKTEDNPTAGRTSWNWPRPQPRLSHHGRMDAAPGGA